MLPVHFFRVVYLWSQPRLRDLNDICKPSLIQVNGLRWWWWQISGLASRWRWFVISRTHFVKWKSNVWKKLDLLVCVIKSFKSSVCVYSKWERPDRLSVCCQSQLLYSGKRAENPLPSNLAKHFCTDNNNGAAGSQVLSKTQTWSRCLAQHTQTSPRNTPFVLSSGKCEYLTVKTSLWHVEVFLVSLCD